MEGKGYMITDARQIKGKTKEYHEQLYSDKSGKLDEMDMFLEGEKLLKLTGKEMEKLIL